MKFEDVKIGMKVVLIKKSIGCRLKDSKAYVCARDKNQPFLFVVQIYTNRICLDDCIDGLGDNFHWNDFEEYEEPQINKTMKFNQKVAFKSDGTADTGRKIIEALESIGGQNLDRKAGSSQGSFYFITIDGKIENRSSYPIGYKVKDPFNFTPESEPLSFPRKMLVWDLDESKAVEREVVAIVPEVASHPIIGITDNWKHAKELPEQVEDPKIKELSDRIEKLQSKAEGIMDEISSLNVELENLKNK